MYPHFSYFLLFITTSFAYPHGYFHAQGSSLPGEAPGNPIELDPTNTAFRLTPGGITGTCVGTPACDTRPSTSPWSWADFIDSTTKNATLGEMCYWSYMTTAPRGPWSSIPFNYSAIQTSTLETIYNMSITSYSALRSSSSSSSSTSVLQNVFMTMGSDMLAYICSNNLPSFKTLWGIATWNIYCSQPHLSQSLRFPASSMILKFTGSNVAAIKSLITSWRTAAHKAVMTSTEVTSQGWAAAGSATYVKIFKCADIPSRHMSSSSSSSIAYLELTTDGTRTVMEDAFQFWSTTRSFLAPVTSSSAVAATPPSSWYDCNGTAVKFFDVTIPNDRDALILLAILYSFLPWVLALFVVIGALVTRRLSLIVTVLYCGVCVFVNEVIVKRIISQNRPFGTCLTTKGMPSSHSFLSIGVATWISLEMWCPPGNWMHMNKWERVLLWALVLGACIPVPPARVILYDHSQEQVGVGSGLGIATAFLYYLLMRLVLKNVLRSFCNNHPTWIQNDYCPTQKASMAAPTPVGSVKDPIRSELERPLQASPSFTSPGSTSPRMGGSSTSNRPPGGDGGHHHVVKLGPLDVTPQQQMQPVSPQYGRYPPQGNPPSLRNNNIGIFENSSVAHGNSPAYVPPPRFDLKEHTHVLL